MDRSFAPPVLLVVLLAAATGTARQMPPIGIVDFYGLRHVTEQQVRDALQINEGTSIPESEDAADRMREAATQRVRALPGVKEVELEAVCCDAGKMIVYVGVVEQGTPVMRFSPPPRGSIRLPADIMRADAAYGEALMAAVQSGDAAEDDSAGHALASNKAVRAIQEQFIGFAARDEARLRDVLAHSSDAEHRAVAAQVLGYVRDKKSVVGALAVAVADPDSGVRNNAVRALAVIASYGAANPQRGIHVAPDPFVALLDSPFWTDRNKASFALAEISVGRDARLLGMLRTRALPSLVEMARWKSRGHAGAAFCILGRIGGLSEDAIAKAWERDDRDQVIAAAQAGK